MFDRRNHWAWGAALLIGWLPGHGAALADAESPTASADPAPTPTSARRLAEADALRMGGYYARAVRAYESLIEESPTDMKAVLGEVSCHLETGCYAKARGVLEAHREAGEAVARWHLQFARVERAVGHYDAVLEQARRAIQLDRQLAAARLLLADTLELLGHRDDAVREYEWFDRLVKVRLPTDAENLTAVGWGFYRYTVLTGHPRVASRTQHVLNRIFQAAYEQVDRNYWPARVAAADLLREKYNLEEAEEDYRAAISINASAADAHVGLGRIALEHWDFEEIERRSARALEINPHHVGALNLRAAGKLVERRYRQALEATDRALAVNPRDVEALALAAAAHLALNDDAKALPLIQRAEAVSPKSWRLHAIVGDTLGGLRRFAEAEKHYQKAIANEPTASSPRVELGLMYMQWGDEARARRVLDAAWTLDKFNERTKNTLELLDELESFAKLETEHFVIHYDKSHDALIAPYFAEVLEGLYHRVCDDFHAQLTRQTAIEIFPTHSQFAVRITGKPWIHTIGACTGWVIALDAPRRGADLRGPYDFANVLRHEFTHTVTLAVTDNRIPHWFTEGLAVLEEDTPRSYAWMELLAEAARRDELFTLESVDWGFMRPKKATDRQLAYAQSEWMCEYLVEKYGHDALGKMLAGFQAKRTQEEVFAALTGEPTSRFDQRFREWASRQVRTWGFDLTPPGDPYKLRALAIVRPHDAGVQARLAKAEYDAKNWARALAAARRSVELDDRANRAGLQILVRVLAASSASAEHEKKRVAFDDETLPPARRLAELDSDNRYALRALGDILVRRHAYDEALPYLRRLKTACPADPFAAKSLAAIYLERGNDDAALPNLLEAAATNTFDPDIPLAIGRIYQKSNQPPDALYWYQRALHIDPLSEPTHERLAQLHMRAGDTAAAIREYEFLCHAYPRVARHFSACALAYHKLGDHRQARAFAAKAVALDSHVPAAALVKP